MGPDLRRPWHHRSGMVQVGKFTKNLLKMEFQTETGRSWFSRGQLGVRAHGGNHRVRVTAPAASPARTGSAVNQPRLPVS